MEQRRTVPYPTLDLDSFTLSEGQSPLLEDPINEDIVSSIPTMPPDKVQEVIIKSKSERVLPNLQNIMDKLKRKKYLRTSSQPQQQESTIFIIRDDDQAPETHKDRNGSSSHDPDIFEESIPTDFRRNYPKLKKERRQKHHYKKPDQYSPVVPVTLQESKNQASVPPESYKLVIKNSPVNYKIPAINHLFLFIDRIIDKRFPVLEQYEKQIKIAVIILIMLQTHVICDTLIAIIASYAHG